MPTESPGFNKDRPARKPYESPKLEVYGDIRDVTESAGMTGSLDGAAMGPNKTQ
jgi:hypothetical protein